MPCGLLIAVRDEGRVGGEVERLVELMPHVGHAEAVLALHLVGEVAADCVDPGEHLLRGGGRRRQRDGAIATALLASPAGREQQEHEEGQHGGEHGMGLIVRRGASRACAKWSGSAKEIGRAHV